MSPDDESPTTLPSTEELAAAGLQLSIEPAQVAWIRLHRPETRNSQTPATWHALARIGAALDEQVRVVVLQGSGPAFSSGLDRGQLSGTGQPGSGDVSELLGVGEATREQLIEGFQQGFSWLADPGRLTIAAVQGYALGAGLQLALACDVRLFAEDARVGLPEPRLGLVPDLGGTLPLVRAVGYHRAVDMVCGSRTVEADEAGRIGLATRVVAGEQLESATRQLVQAAVELPQTPMLESLRLLHHADRRLGNSEAPGEALGWQLAAERAAQNRCLEAMAQQARG